MKTRILILLTMAGMLLAACTNTTATETAATPGAQEEAVPSVEVTETPGYPVDQAPPGAIDDSAYPAPGEPVPGAGESGYPAPVESGSGYPAPVEGSAGYPAPANGCTLEAAAIQALELTAADGVVLAGSFYPPAACSAPVVVLFHQFGSTKEAWAEIATWLQNRPAETGPAAAWLPALPADLSFAVFAIDFRGHGASQAGDEDGFDDDGYLRDAQAALAFARTLPNVDANRVITLGASIGADASVDACAAFDGDDLADVQENQGCIGALPLSPGNYLGVSYAEVVTLLSEPPFDMRIHCVATEQDGESPQLCSLAISDRHTGTVYPGRSEHGMAMLAAGFDPDTGLLIRDFLLAVLGFGN